MLVKNASNKKSNSRIVVWHFKSQKKQKTKQNKNKKNTLWKSKLYI